MEMTTVVLILGILAILGVLVFGGKVKVSKAGIELNTQGYVDYMQKAHEKKGSSDGIPTPVQPVEAKTKQRVPKLPRALIAWVDDDPLGNQFERLALASVGIFCDSYTNNYDANFALSQANYDLVISDIRRDGRAETGWDLLPDVRKRNIPFVFYTMGITEELKTRARVDGAAGIVENPDDLMQLVFDLIKPRT